MTEEDYKAHPVTPPPKLLDKWLAEWAANDEVTCPQVEYVATQAARWGATVALCAAADQVVPEESLYGGDQRWQFERDARQECRRKLLAIATELENF